MFFWGPIKFNFWCNVIMLKLLFYIIVTSTLRNAYGPTPFFQSLIFSFLIGPKFNIIYQINIQVQLVIKRQTHCNVVSLPATKSNRWNPPLNLSEYLLRQKTHNSYFFAFSWLKINPFLKLFSLLFTYFHRWRSSIKMEPHALTVKPPGFHFPSTKNCRRHISVPVLCRRVTVCSVDARPVKRRDLLVTPLVALGAYALRSAVAKADETPPLPPPPAAEATATTAMDAAAAAEEEVISSRIYDATVIGEPLAVGKDKKKVWEKMMNARIVYLGEAEQVPTRDDKEVEIEIVKNLRKRCAQLERNLSLALEAFPCDLQEQLDRYLDRRFDFDSTFF